MSIYDADLTSPFDPLIDQLGWYDKELISLIFANAATTVGFATTAIASVVIGAASTVTIPFTTTATGSITSSSIFGTSSITIPFSTTATAIIIPQLFAVTVGAASVSAAPTPASATIGAVTPGSGSIAAIPVGSGQIQIAA